MNKLYIIDHPGDSWTIQDKPGGGGTCVAQQYGGSPREFAELLCRAANSYDALVAACALAADELTHATWAKGADQRGLKYAIEKCQAAIAAAKEGRPSNA